MDLSFGLVIFIAIFAVTLVVLFFVARQRDQALKGLAELSAQRGWQFERKPSAYVDCVLRGQGAGVRWELQYINKERTSSSEDNVESILWFSSGAKAANGTTLVYPRLGGIPSNLQPGNLQVSNALAGELLNKMMRALGVDISGSSLQAAGSTAFQAKYMTLAPDAPSAQRLAAAVEFQLLNWPGTGSLFNMPSLIVDTRGVTVRVARNGLPTGHQIQVAEHMVSLGVAAVNAVG